MFELHNIISHLAKTGLWLSWPEVQIIPTAPPVRVGAFPEEKEDSITPQDLLSAESHQNWWLFSPVAADKQAEKTLLQMTVLHLPAKLKPLRQT